MDDQNAAKQLKQGNLSGLEFLVRKYQLQAIRAVYIIVRDKGAAEDIVQQGFVRVCEHIDQYDEQRPFSPWFFKIVINDALKYVKRERKVLPLEFLTNWEEEICGIIQSHSDPEQAAQQSEVQERLWTALGDLSPEQRAVFVLRYYFDYSIPELLDELKQPLTTIKWRLRAARKRLFQKLRNDGI